MTQLNLLNLKNVFLYEIGLIAICEVSPPFDGGHTSLSTTALVSGPSMACFDHFLQGESSLLIFSKAKL